MCIIDRFDVLSMLSTCGGGTTASDYCLESLGDHCNKLLFTIVWGVCEFRECVSLGSQKQLLVFSLNSFQWQLTTDNWFEFGELFAFFTWQFYYANKWKN